MYQYGATPPDRLPRARYGRRAVAFLIDSIIVLALPVAAFVALRVGPNEIRSCEVTEDGRVAVFGGGVATGLCRAPTAATFAIAGLLAALGVAIWFGYVMWEGRSTRTIGKRLLGLRTVDARTAEPIGAGRNLGRNLVRGMLVLFLVPFVIDHLWPLWDRDGQTLHDKVASAAVVPEAR